MAKIIIRRAVTHITRSAKPQIIKLSKQGPPGASANVSSHIAGVALGGHRAVVLDGSEQAVYADKDTPLHAAKVFGITSGAVTLGSSAAIQTYGEMSEPSWAWTPGLPIYCGNTGLLTQTAPTTGFLLVMAFAITATKIFIDIKIPITLS